MLSAVRARQLFAVHRWTGLLSGLVILFLSVTGAGLVFITEIDRFLNQDLMVTESVGPVVPPEAAIASALAAYPDLRVNRVDLLRFDNSTYALWTRPVDGPEPFDQVMVDPHTAEVLGTRLRTASFAFVLRQLHLRFYAFGWQGRVVIGVFGLVLVLSTVTGLLIYTRFIRALPHWWSIRRDRGFQISTSDWHKLVGIVALVFNLIIAVTGAVLGLENLARFSPAVSRALHPTADRSQFPDPPETLDGALPVSEIVARARAGIPGFEPTYVSLPQVERSHYTIHGNLEGKIAMEGATSAGLHAHTGEMFYTLNATAARPVTKAYYWMDPLHFGNWGGVWSQILYVIFGLTTGFLSITGYILWFAKKRRRSRAAVPQSLAAAA